MKILRYALLMAASLVLPGCNDEMPGPTAPVAYAVVAGPWQGNVSYQALVGFYVEAPCPEQPVTVQFQQEGRRVTGTIQADCLTAQFEGEVAQNLTISGRVTRVFDGQTFSARLTGSLVGSPVSQIEAETEVLETAPGGFQSESFRLRLTR
jgi:hypothetical protein